MMKLAVYIDRQRQVWR